MQQLVTPIAASLLKLTRSYKVILEGSATPQTLHWFQWGAPHSPPILPPPVDRSPNPTSCLIPGPIRPSIPNRIHIRSAVLPQCTGRTDRQTVRQTNRCLEGMFDDYRPLSLFYKERRHGLNNMTNKTTV